jgi:hypothetical protein
LSRRDCALRAHFPELRLSRQERSAFERCVSCIHCSTTAPGALTRPSTRDATRRSATATLPPCRTASRPVCVLAALQSARANCARQPPVRAALTQSTLPPALWTDRLFPHGRYQCCCSQPVQRLRRCLRPRRSARGCPALARPLCESPQADVQHGSPSHSRLPDRSGSIELGRPTSPTSKPRHTNSPSAADPRAAAHL